ncbi:CD109 antigen [Lepeophtheirus salmonis]|uniref:CD109 antigen n=1 Tax=Lepeophtheirus salmonis TaxID=72036 RepID=UPI003AF39BAA
MTYSKGYVKLCYFVILLHLMEGIELREKSGWGIRGKESEYYIIAPRTIRPHSIYKIIVHIRNPDSLGRLEIHSSISNNGVKLTDSILKENSPSHLEELMMKIPGHIRNETQNQTHLKVQLSSSSLGKKEYSALLNYTKEFLSITIESDRLIYTGGQSIHLRCIFTDLDFKPYKGQGNMWIVDPEGFIVRRWISRSLNLGVLTNHLTLPEYPKVGFWKCIVSAESQMSEISFKVEKYYSPPLEVSVSLPPFVDPGNLNGMLEAEVEASFLTERMSKGNIYLKWMASEIDDSTPLFEDKCTGFEPQRTKWIPLQESVFLYSSLLPKGAIVWVLPLSKIEREFGTLINIQVRAEVTYTDYFFNGTEKAFAETRLLPSDILIRGVYKDFVPGMPFRIQFFVIDSITKEKLSEEELLQGTLSIIVEVEFEDSSFKKILGEFYTNEYIIGVDLSLSSDSLFKEHDPDYVLTKEYYKAFIGSGIYDMHLQCTPSNAKYMQIIATFETEDKKTFFNETVSNGGHDSGLQIYISSAIMDVLVGNYIVFHVKTNFYLTHYNWMIMSKDIILKSGSESVGLQESKISSTFSLVVSSQMVPSFHMIVYTLQGIDLISDFLKVDVNPMGNDLAHFQFSQIKDHGMWTVEAACKGIPGSIFMVSSMRKKSFDNGQGRNIITKESYLKNFERILTFNDPRDNLIIMDITDQEIRHSYLSKFNEPLTDNCNDNYYLSRENRYNDFYDSGDGNWGYKSLNIDHDGEFFVNLDIPESPDDWIFLITSISPNGEVTFLQKKFYKRMMGNEEVVLKLLGSDNYRFVEVEAFGFVKSFSPRMSGGERHHLIFVRPGESFEVNFPIAPEIESGTLSVEIHMSTQLMLVSQVVNVLIEPEGSPVLRHTSFMLDLKNRGKVYKFAKIVVDESPIIPYEVYRRFIYGSAKGTLTISGDVVGPIFPQDTPVSSSILFPEGRSYRIPTKGAEVHLFNLGANALQLHYIRLTNQASKLDSSLISDIFETMNLEFLGVLRYYSAHGWISTHDSSDPSVYLTAWALYVFHHVVFHDWEEYIYLDKNIMASSILWLVNYQTYRGDFIEYLSFFPLSPWPNFHLTAFVLIALEKTCFLLSGNERRICFIARSKAQNVIEENLQFINDVTDLAICSYALVLSKSDLSTRAYEKLKLKAIVTNGNIYWSPHPITPNVVKNEFNRPFMEAKICQDQDAGAVQSTSYALLTSLLIAGSGIMTEQDRIIKWLNTMRQSSGGFISFVDTIIALDGLIQYSYNSRMKDVTNLKINVDLPQSNISKEITIQSSNIHITHIIDIPNVYGHVNFFAKGSGQAVAQLNVEYGVDFEPFTDKSPKDYFHLTIKENYSGRNKSEIEIESCFKWTLTNESNASGPAMLVVDIPTGYIMNQPEANMLVRKRVVPEIVDADVTKSGRTIWYFSHISSKLRCFSHSVRRYFPVSNHTRTRQAIIIETINPERFFIRTFNSTSLHVLSICEVCGSYQCPYCPTYSGWKRKQDFLYLFKLLPIFSLLINYI